ncbi:pyridoxamine 5'-phosphate oxidase family protein [Sulfitobacter sp. S190]|uniref:FAD-binding oxidoreductase n=1 Tax=Sulfitobacter sp. S190 TaxID=2867022 RepID=UPI0021A4E62E|nr:pyridoxamine 5'-phosphate oxidase family protein [Sulfitobacter sp. S190]UWR21722.1 pyridoxamine 5'-phosphate oxidase family protein [Sulfitobacter sp. S190]
MQDIDTPFHAGEIEAQKRAGAGDVASWAAGFIRDAMPDQHRAFFSNMPFLVTSGEDSAGFIWTTLIEGRDGFIESPDPRRLTLDTAIDARDPLAAAFNAGADIGVLGIELASRRRNRMSGTIRPENGSYVIDVRQSFGNCPQYIHERTWRRVTDHTPADALSGDHLTPSQSALVRGADTLFIGSGHTGRGDAASDGFDASHRGGAPGFVEVAAPDRLRIPDYAGNNFFNTIGNLMTDPRIGLVFVDFATGGLLHVSGRARVDWAPSGMDNPAIRRMIDVTVERVIERPAALSLRWAADDADLRTLIVQRKVVEADGLTSFYLAAADGDALAPFEPGQHLPVELAVPGAAEPVRRSYSLSGPADAKTYRLTIKREDKGTASRFLHDNIAQGDTIAARRPSGDFVVPCSTCPLVLVSVGVGLTPMLSILHSVASEQTDRPAWYVHGARDGAQHALGDEVTQLAAMRDNIHVHTAYSRPRDTDLTHDQTGRITAQSLLSLGAGPDAQYMLCGPAAFLSDIRTGLEDAGVPAGNIHFETFGPTG